MTVKRARIKGEGMRDDRVADGWIYADTFIVPGKRHKLVKGREFKVTGERGARFRFHEVVTTSAGFTSITAYGGPKHHGQWRAFDPARVASISSKLPRLNMPT